VQGNDASTNPLFSSYYAGMRNSQPKSNQDSQRGATSMVVACTIASSIAMAALVIDVGNLLATKAELQMVADLSAKSAARELARVYMTTGRADPLSDTLSLGEQAQVTAAADHRARRNSAGSVPITVASGDVEIGKWDMAKGTLLGAGFGVDAVKVRARRDEISNGMVAMLLPGILGRDSVPLVADAAAKLSGIRYLPAGTADFPVAIAKAWYRTHASPCSTGNTITFYPTGSADGCAGWHTFTDDPANGATLKSILDGLRLGTFVSPAIDTDNTSFIFSGGTITSAIAEAINLYEAKKDANGELAVLLPVYDRDDCSNPNGWIRIIGVARAVITHIETGADKRIEARVQCDVVDIGESGGTDFGVLAAGPDLVR